MTAEAGPDAPPGAAVVAAGIRSPAPWLAARVAVAVTAVAVVCAALWLRSPRELYLAVVLTATALGGAAAWGVGTRWARGAAGAFALAAVAFLGPSAAAARAVRRIADAPSAAEARARQAAAALDKAVTEAARRTDALAGDAVKIGFDGGEPFAALRRLVPPAAMVGGGEAERAVALFRGDTLVAWAGPWRLRPDALAPDPRGGVALARNPFYLALHAHRRAGSWRAVATTLLHADPPGDTLAAALDGRVARAHGVRGFAYPQGSRAGALGARPLVPGAAEARERALDEGRRGASPAILLMALVWVAAVWRRGPGRRPARGRLLARRLVSLCVPATVLAVAPLNALSNATRLFDPSVYYSAVGGRFTSSVGSLTLTGLLLAVGLLAALRAGARVPSRPAGLAVVALVAAGAPYLLRELSRGIAPPAGGAPVWLWVAWQVALFVVAAALLLVAAVAARTALGPGRGLPPAVAVAAAAAAAFAGPLLWDATAGWPAWYPLPWALAVVALAFTRRTAGLLVASAAVAGLGSATMVWSATALRRVELAERDVRGLAAPDAEAMRLVERLGDAVADSARAGMLTLVDPGGSSLLRVYARSPLASAGNPVALALWAADSVVGFPLPDRLAARVATAGWRVDSAALAAAVADTRRTGAPVLRAVSADVGAATVYARPLDRGRTLTVTLFPRTRLRPDDPVAALLGQAAGPEGEPPYTLALVERGPAQGSAGIDLSADASLAALAIAPARWAREGDALHGDWVLPLPGGPARAHAEVALRPVGVLAARGLLLTLVDVALAGLLWALPALADGALGPARRRWRLTWLSSFRARLTLALLAFSGAPTIAFAAWSYRQLQVSDRESRALLVRETLRDALAQGAGAATAPVLAAASARAGTPLLAYVGGVLEAASEPAVVELAPLGRVLPDGETAGVGRGGEVTASAELRVAGRDATVGFRSALGLDGRRVVLAAPARADDYLLDRRRRDLGFLVALAAAAGGLASLWLSGLAARQLSRPVGALRRAALVIGEGTHDRARLDEAFGTARRPAPGGGRLPARWRPGAWRLADPPAEFRPVFGAFRQMAADLAVGREALEAARRRTAAVLRDVASGVLAVDADARVTLANPRVEALLGQTMLPGSALDGRGPALLAARVRAFVWRGGASPDEDAFDVEVGGRQLRARLTRLGGAQGGAVLTLDDLTDLARAERVLAWGEMARQVAHEIKNPLTPIRLGVQLLRRAHRDGRGDFGPLLEATVERVLAEIDRLDEIARSFSKYGTAPERQPPAEPLDAAAVARDVVALERLGQGRVAWEIEGADGPAPAMARDGELREVLLNLLENARLAGAARVTLRLTRDDGHVTLAVADDGEGIAPDVLPRIFEPRFSTRTSGSGLGLAISRRLVEAWGGDVRAESRQGPDGSGTTVTLRLRAAASAPGV